MKKNGFVLLLAASLLIGACHHKDGVLKDEKITDTKLLPVKIRRYEMALFSVNPDSMQQQLKKQASVYPFFLSDGLDDTLTLMQLHDFITDPEVIKVFQNCKTVYPDLSDVEKQFGLAFQRYRHYFPGKTQPTVYTYISNFSDVEFPVKYIDSTLIISLDMYLGKNFKPYLEAGIPQYKINRMAKEFLLPDAMKEIASSYLIPPMENRTLLDEMVREGKKMYFADLTLPETPDDVKIGYTSSQIKWCNENEGNIWTFMIENKLLYSTYFQAFSKFITDGPFTADFSKDSPAKIGSWIGWQIVRSYMENNPKVSPQQLMNDMDAQRILTEAKYKPRND